MQTQDSRAKMWDLTVPSRFQAEYLTQHLCSLLPGQPSVHQTQDADHLSLGSKAATEGKSQPHLVRTSIAYLSHPKPQPRYPHRNVCSPGLRVGAQGGQPSTEASSYPNLPSSPPLPETQLLLQRPSGPVWGLSQVEESRSQDSQS